MTRTFKTKKELAERLIAGEKWRVVGHGHYCYYDETRLVPFRYSGAGDIYDSWSYCDGTRQWEQIIDKQQPKPNITNKMRSFNRQLAWLAENDDGWREDWKDSMQKKWFIYYDHSKKSYGASYETENQDNKIYMSEYNVKILAEALNFGEVVL
jgi:hypothetical protein